jgi:hypothetical protein
MGGVNGFPTVGAGGADPANPHCPLFDPELTGTVQFRAADSQRFPFQLVILLSLMNSTLPVLCPLVSARHGG